jgi:hypothetical protein
VWRERRRCENNSRGRCVENRHCTLTARPIQNVNAARSAKLKNASTGGIDADFYHNRNFRRNRRQCDPEGSLLFDASGNLLGTVAGGAQSTGPSNVNGALSGQAQGCRAIRA